MIGKAKFHYADSVMEFGLRW